MPKKIIVAQFDHASVNSVRVSVLAYRRPKEHPTNAEQKERLRHAKELAKTRVLEAVEARPEPLLGAGAWVAVITLPNNIQKTAANGGIFRVLIRAEGRELTYDAAGKVVGTRTVATFTRAPIRLAGMDS